MIVIGALSCTTLLVEGKPAPNAFASRSSVSTNRKEQRHSRSNTRDNASWQGRGGFATSRRANLFTPRPAHAASVKLKSTYAPRLNDNFRNVRYDVIDGDLLLPSQRALPPVVKEISYSNDWDESMQKDVPLEATVSRKLDMALFLTYACNTFVLTLPVILMPMIAAEHGLVLGPKFVTGVFIAAAASIATLGGGVGKIINGFVCQGLGGRKSASLYLFGMGLFSFLLSMNRSLAAVGIILAGLEFCASMQWTAHSLLLVNHYEKNPVRFAAGMTTLSMASTAGIIAAKVGGSAFLQYMPSWRALARIGAGVAVTGGLLAQGLVTEWPELPKGRLPWPAPSAAAAQAKPKKALKPRDILKSLRHVMGSRIFWQVGFAHATTSLARTSDKILGGFFQDTTALSTSLCGGLTAFVTIGFLHGLSKGRQFHELKDSKSKSRMLRKSYAVSVLSTVGMAMCANKWLTGIVCPSKMVLAIVAAMFSGVMASSLSIQYFQIPTIVAQTFGENKAVCLSFLDGLAFFLSAPILAGTGQIVGRLGDYGWSTALSLLAVLFGVGGLLMVDIFPSVVDAPEEAASSV